MLYLNQVKKNINGFCLRVALALALEISGYQKSKSTKRKRKEIVKGFRGILLLNL